MGRLRHLYSAFIPTGSRVSIHNKAEIMTNQNREVEVSEVRRLDLREFIEEVLMEQIDLSRPDDLAFLESQVPYIAGCIIHHLNLRHGCS